MSVQSDLLKERAQAFGVRVLRLIDKLPPTTGAQVVAYQLPKSSTSFGANYVAACNGRSHAEFAAKLCIVNEETDEPAHWLRVIIEVPYLQEERGDAALRGSHGAPPHLWAVAWNSKTESSPLDRAPTGLRQ